MPNGARRSHASCQWNAPHVAEPGQRKRHCEMKRDQQATAHLIEKRPAHLEVNPGFARAGKIVKVVDCLPRRRPTRALATSTVTCMASGMSADPSITPIPAAEYSPDLVGAYQVRVAG